MERRPSFVFSYLHALCLGTRPALTGWTSASMSPIGPSKERVMKSVFLVVLVAGLNLALAGSKIAPDVPKSKSTTFTDVIVRFKAPPTKDDLKQLGPYGQIKKQLTLVNAVLVSLSQADIQTLENNPAVAYVSPNRILKGALDITTQTVGANLAWNLGWTGAGVGVAVIDSGVALKRDLAAANGITSRVVYSQSFVAGQDTSDLYGHGTHVAGIVGSNGLNSSGLGFSRTFKGVAPGVNLISLKVLDQNGAGSESGVIDAIQTAINLKNTYNIRVIN